MTVPDYPPFRSLEADWDPQTVAVQAGRPAHEPGAGMNSPIVLSSTYLHDAPVEYARDGNLGWAALETAIGALEGGVATAFASGVAAALAVADLVAPGGTVVLPSVVYSGVRLAFEQLAATGRLSLRVARPDDDAEVVAASEGADLVWVESVANPLMVVPDVPAIAAGARRHGALTVVDATFATPLRQRPLALGADLVVHSATKFIGGHSDLTLGVVVSRSEDHARRAWQFRRDRGAVPGALEAYLALRGLRTLGVRLERAEASAAELARRLDADPRIAAVHYPGLATDPSHDVAARVLSGGFGAMLAFDVAATVEQTERFLSGLRLVAHATSLGGVESTIERRARYDIDALVAGPTMCRMSVGLESVDDLWRDLDRALGGALAA